MDLYKNFANKCYMSKTGLSHQKKEDKYRRKPKISTRIKRNPRKKLIDFTKWIQNNLAGRKNTLGNLKAVRFTFFEITSLITLSFFGSGWYKKNRPNVKYSCLKVCQIFAPNLNR